MYNEAGSIIPRIFLIQPDQEDIANGPQHFILLVLLNILLGIFVNVFLDIF